MKKDLLYDIFEGAINDHSIYLESAEELIHRVVDSYMAHLTKVGTIPHFLWADVISDLQMEVTEIYRKKTYGHMNLQDYRDKNKSRRRTSLSNRGRSKAS